MAEVTSLVAQGCTAGAILPAGCPILNALFAFRVGYHEPKPRTFPLTYRRALGHTHKPHYSLLATPYSLSPAHAPTKRIRPIIPQRARVRLPERTDRSRPAAA